MDYIDLCRIIRELDKKDQSSNEKNHVGDTITYNATLFKKEFNHRKTQNI